MFITQQFLRHTNIIINGNMALFRFCRSRFPPYYLCDSYITLTIDEHSIVALAIFQWWSASRPRILSLFSNDKNARWILWTVFKPTLGIKRKRSTLNSRSKWVVEVKWSASWTLMIRTCLFSFLKHLACFGKAVGLGIYFINVSCRIEKRKKVDGHQQVYIISSSSCSFLKLKVKRLLEEEQCYNIFAPLTFLQLKFPSIPFMDRRIDPPLIVLWCKNTAIIWSDRMTPSPSFGIYSDSSISFKWYHRWQGLNMWMEFAIPSYPTWSSHFEKKLSAIPINVLLTKIAGKLWQSS